MEISLFLCSLWMFALCPAAAPLALRCGLTACMRFSPRASCALSGIAAFSGYLTAFMMRGCFRSPPVALRASSLLSAFVGGVAGRMALIAFTARFSGSLTLSRVHAIPLLFLAIASLPLFFPALHPSRTLSFISPALAFLTSLIDGFCGAGGCILLSLCCLPHVQRIRSRLPAPALALCLPALLGALLLAHFSGSAQVFPARMILSLCAGSACGAGFFEHAKKHGALRFRMRAVLAVYIILAALSCAEQALR